MLGTRNIRGEMNIGPGKPLPLYLKNVSAEDQRRLTENEALLKKLARLESITVLAAGEEAPLSATALVGEMEVLVPMAGLIDKGAELARLDKEIQRQGEVNALAASCRTPASSTRPRPKSSRRNAPNWPRLNRPWASWQSNTRGFPACNGKLADSEAPAWPLYSRTPLVPAAIRLIFFKMIAALPYMRSAHDSSMWDNTRHFQPYPNRSHP
jgi:hypothetical protein